jgi:hypothetical protein
MNEVAQTVADSSMTFTNTNIAVIASLCVIYKFLEPYILRARDKSSVKEKENAEIIKRMSEEIQKHKTESEAERRYLETVIESERKTRDTRCEICEDKNRHAATEIAVLKTQTVSTDKKLDNIEKKLDSLMETIFTIRQRDN